MNYWWSFYPFTTLVYLADSSKIELKQVNLLRQDKILNAVDSAGTIRTLFNDFISCFSPLSSSVGDEYYLATVRYMKSFMIG